MQRSHSYEWLLESCLQECRKGISHLEQLAAAGDESSRTAWLREDIAELLALEAAAVDSLTTLRRVPDDSPESTNFAQDRVDRLQSKLLQSFQHLATQNVGRPPSDCAEHERR